MQASGGTANIRRSHPHALAARQQPLQPHLSVSNACRLASRRVQRRKQAMGSPEGSTLSSRYGSRVHAALHSVHQCYFHPSYFVCCRTTAAALITAAAAAAVVAPSLSTSAAALSPVLAVAVVAAAATTVLLQYVLRTPSSSSSSEGAKQASAAAAAYPEPSSLANLIKGRRSVFPRDFSGETRQHIWLMASSCMCHPRDIHQPYCAVLQHSGCVPATIQCMPAAVRLMLVALLLLLLLLPGEPVSKAALEAMLSSAIWAPSHKLTEPWHFVVLEGQSKQDFIALTRRLVEKNAPPAKMEAQLAKLDRKTAADWTKVSTLLITMLSFLLESTLHMTEQIRH